MLLYKQLKLQATTDETTPSSKEIGIENKIFIYFTKYFTHRTYH